MNAFQQQNADMAEAPAPMEKYAHNSGAGVGAASPYRDVPEVQGSNVERPVAYEMPGSAPAEMDGGAPVRR